MMTAALILGGIAVGLTFLILVIGDHLNGID
jgi:hypothetical protein